MNGHSLFQASLAGIVESPPPPGCPLPCPCESTCAGSELGNTRAREVLG